MAGNDNEFPDPFDFLKRDVSRIQDSFTEALQRRKEELATQTVFNLVKAGVLKESEIGLKQRLMTFDLFTLTQWFLHSHILRETESKRLE